MIVRSKIRLRTLVLSAWRKILFMTIYSGAFVVAYKRGYADVAIPTGVATMLGTALSIILAFRTNSAYDRWWEARKIWGAIVNDSRSFARQVLTLFTAPEDDKASLHSLQRELVYRQIGWCYALKASLRGQTPFTDLEPFLSAEERKALQTRDNVPNAILHTQAEWVRHAREKQYLDRYLSLVVETTLTAFSNHMGMCERIKKTVFSTPYSFIISRIIWLFFLLLPAGLIQHLGWFTIPVSVLVASFFLLIELLSTHLQDPFENRSTDTPMTSICRTIEIDLRQQLGETELPPKVEPIDGVLM